MATQSLLSVVLGLDSKKFTTGIGRTQKKLQRVSASLKKTGRSMSTALTAPLVAIGASSFKVAADFELAMKKVKAISGATGSDFKLLESEARRLGASTVFSASQVAELQLEMAKLGLGAQEIKNATGDTLSLAQAFGNELGPTAETVIKTLNQFGLEALEAGRVSDVMAVSFAGSALDLEKFAGSMANAGPVAKQFGFSMEETTALLGVLANNGIEGADAGTKLKMAFSKLAAEGVDVKETFRGIISGSLDYKDAITLLGKRAAILSPIFGENLDDLAKLQDKFAGAEGAAGRMAAEMNATASGGLAAMRSAIEGAQITLGNALAPAIMKVIGFVTDLAQRFSELSPKTQELIVVVGGLAAALGPLLMVVGALASPIGIAAAAMTALAIGIGKVVVRQGTMQTQAQTLQGAIKGLNTKLAEETAEAKVLFARIKDVNTAEDDRATAIQTLQDKYGEYLPNLDLNKAKLEDIETAERKLIGAIEDRVRAQVLADAQQAKVAAETEIKTKILVAEAELVGDGLDVASVREIGQFIQDEINAFVNNRISLAQLEKSLGNLYGDAITDAFTEELDLGSINLLGGGFTGFASDILELSEAKNALANLEIVLADLKTKKGVVAEAVDTGDEPAAVVEETTEDIKKLGDVSTTTKDTINDLIDTQRTFTDVNNELEQALTHIDEKMQLFEDFDGKGAKVAVLTAAINELIDSDIDVPAGELQKLADKLKTFTGTVTETEDPLKTLTTTLKSLEVSTELGIIDSLQAARSILNALETALRDSVLADPNFINTDKFKELNDLMTKLRGEIGETKITQDTLNESFDVGATVGQTIGQIVSAGFDSMTNSGESFGEAVKSIFVNLIKGALSTAIANAITAAFSPASPDNIATGGAAAPIKAAKLKAIVAAMFAGIPKFNQGGMTLGPQLALIGDNPSGREAVIPFERMGAFLQMAGAGSNNVNVTGKIRGQDIVLSQERAMRNRGR